MGDSGQACAGAAPPCGDAAFAILDSGALPVAAAEIRRAIRRVQDGEATEVARDRNSICYRVPLASAADAHGMAVIKVPRPGPQRTNGDVTFAGEAAILAQAARRRDHPRLSPAGPGQGGRRPFSADHSRARRASGSAAPPARRAVAAGALRQPLRDGLPGPDALRPQAGEHPARWRSPRPHRLRIRAFRGLARCVCAGDVDVLRGLQRFGQSAFSGPDQCGEFRIQDACRLPRRPRTIDLGRECR